MRMATPGIPGFMESWGRSIRCSDTMTHPEAETIATTDGREADVTTAVAPSAAALTASDRCDRCGAQAYLRVQLSEGAELLFCAHHAREHGDKLREIAVELYDETGKLGVTPSPGGDS